MKVAAEDHFSGWFEPEFLKELTQIAIYSRVPKGEELKSTSAFVKYIPLVIKGRIKVLKPSEEGKYIFLYSIHKGEICTMSYSLAMEHGKTNLKMIAEEETELFLIPFQQITNWMKHYSSWNSYIVRLFAVRYQNLLNDIDLNSKHQPEEKLRKILLSKSRNNNSKKIVTPQEKLASEIGTTKSVVSKLLKRLEEKGFIKRNKSTILLLTH